MEKQFLDNVASLVGTKIISVTDIDSELAVTFSNSTKLTATYWRVSGERSRRFSSFDRNQKYGLESPIDTTMLLQKLFTGQSVVAAGFSQTTGDIWFSVDGQKVEIFNFSSYEVWEIEFGDGSGQLSNYV